MTEKITTFFLTGGSGFIGTAFVLSQLYKTSSVRFFIQTRFPEKYKNSETCRYVRSYLDVPEEDYVDAVINLAGAPIADKAWTDARKKVLEQSRIDLTKDLLKQVRERKPPRVVVSASAVGFYGTGAKILDESSPSGTGFAAQLCREWEEEAEPFQAFSRLVTLRLGVVIGRGGMLTKLLPLYRLGLGGKIASGKQWLSWVALEDVLSAIETAIENEAWMGPYNLCAPEPVTQGEFAKCLAQSLSRPALLPTPGFLLEMLFGEMAKELLISGQRIMPKRLIEQGFQFACPDIASAVDAALRVK